jgi:membrane dipeptidase
MTADTLQARVEELHRQAIVIDGHSDILNPLADGRLRLRDRAIVERPEHWQGEEFARRHQQATPYQLSPYAMWFQCIGQYDIPRFQEGGLTAQVMAVYLGEEHLADPLSRALDMVAAFHREIDDNPDSLVLATTADDIRQAKADGKTALLLSFEGGEPLGRNLNLLDSFYRLGLRMVSLTHSRRNFLADGTQMNIQTGGLTQLGRTLIERMNELGIVIDLAHLSDVGAWEILESSKAPVIISHTNVRAGSPGYRAGLLDVDPRHGTSKLKALARTGGVAGVIFWNQPDVNAIVSEIDAIIQHAGDDYVALGSDYFSLDRAPQDLEDISRLPVLTERLLRRGYSDQTVLKILGGNLLRVFDAVLS